MSFVAALGSVAAVVSLPRWFRCRGGFVAGEVSLPGWFCCRGGFVAGVVSLPRLLTLPRCYVEMVVVETLFVVLL